jgi:DNA-binding GntR family transcriptional regulator
MRIPAYRELYEKLRKQITSGMYKEGDLLPSEHELCQQFGITRPTVRHALDTLVNDGFIKKHKGKGSIVHAIPNGIGILSVGGTTSALGQNNLKTEIIVKPKLIRWPEPFMFPLGGDESESGCYCMERLRLVNDRPIFYDINYLPNINIPRFTARNFANRSLFDLLRKSYQIEIKGGEQKLSAIPADEKISNYLGIDIGKPVLHMERRINTNRPGYHIFSSLYCDTSSYALYGTF